MQQEPIHQNCTHNVALLAMIKLQKGKGINYQGLFGTQTANNVSCVVEEYQRGYSRLAAFMSLDANFSMVKRFDFLHMRHLLYLQDSLIYQQERLDTCDDADDIQLHHSSRRQDDNETRKALMQELEVLLNKYG